MKDCIFCKIIKGDIPAHKIYEDEKVYAFLDIKPLSKGHILVLPKEHYENIFDIPEELYGYIFQVVKKLSVHINEIYKPKGIFINQNNGELAGQSVFHAHIHVKPIYNGEQTHEETDKRMTLSEKEMNQIQEDLKIN